MLLDTSLLIAALDPGHRAYAHASNFLRYAANEVVAQRTILVTTELALEEGAHAITRQALDDDARHGKYPAIEHAWRQRTGSIGKFTWNDLFKDHPQAIKNHVVKVERFFLDLRAVPVQTIDPGLLVNLPVALPDRMTEFMKRYGLLAADAYHLAIADVLDIGMVATLDKDWLQAEQDFEVLIDRP